MDVRARHIKGVIEDGFRIGEFGKEKGKKIYPTAGIKSRIKSLFNMMLDYAVEYEIADRNYARTFEISDEISEEVSKVKRAHIPFTEDELESLWTHVDTVKFVDWILIQSYMGWRPQELGGLLTCDVDLDKWTITGGMKTESGKRRTVPIHSRIRQLIEKNIRIAKDTNSEYLFSDTGQTHSGSTHVTYDKYRHRFNKVVDELGLNSEHRAHDPRVTFVTRAKKAGIADAAIKKIVGHRITDITEASYTARDIEWLRQDIEKLT
jgi:integrase